MQSLIQTRQGKTRQSRHTGTPGVTSRQDEHKLNRQELKYTGLLLTHTAERNHNQT